MANAGVWVENQIEAQMKVGSSSSSSGTRKSSGAKPAAGGFRIASPDSAPAAAPVSGASGAAGVSAVSAILALQSAPEEATPRALRKGRRLLDALDRLQLALLGEGPTASHLSLLRRALAEERPATNDAGLDEVLNWAEVRVAVEAAKLEKAAQAA